MKYIIDDITNIYIYFWREYNDDNDDDGDDYVADVT